MLTLLPSAIRLSPAIWRYAFLLIMSISALFVAAPARAEYQVQPGDVLEISVVGAPELHRRVLVGSDGLVNFPLVGEIKAAGAPASHLRQELREMLAAKHAFDNADVTVDIVQYRPISITGDIAKPGVYPYRPGMTVRDAIALAGGEGQNRASDPSEARDRLGTLSVQSAKLQVHIARLKAELSAGMEIELKELQSGGVATSLMSRFIDLETQQLRTEREDYNNEKGYLARVRTNTQEQLAALLTEQQQRELVLAQLQKDAARTQQLFERSLAPITRVEDQQRTIATWTTQLSDLRARIAQTRGDLEGTARKLQRLADQKKLDIMQRMEAATAELAILRVHLANAGQATRYTTAEGEQLALGARGSPRLLIFRSESGGPRRIVADEGTSLLAGDAIEIATGAAALPNLMLKSGSAAQDVAGDGSEPSAADALLPVLTVPVPEDGAAALPSQVNGSTTGEGVGGPTTIFRHAAPPAGAQLGVFGTGSTNPVAGGEFTVKQ